MTSRSGGTDLVDATDTSLVIPTLDTGTSYASLSTFPANHWGYKQDSGNYKPFETNTTILENSSYTNVDTTTLNFATKIDYLQEAGAYSTTLVFNTTVNPIVDYMQNFTPTMCRTLASAGDYTVADKRDGKEYNVRWINGNCWMTENLRYVGDKGSTSGSMAMKAATSNISADTTTTYIDLDGNATYDDAAIHVGVDDNNDPTVWYNYAAASAMTITGSSNTNVQTYDVCPKGWRLPTKSEQDGITSQISAYSPVAGGMYYNGAHYQANDGMWWLSTSVNATMRYYLEWNKTTLTTNTQYRNNGLYVRCILQPQTMQSFSPADANLMATNEERTLRDSRDGQLYTVKKLGDGNVWMTRNIAIGCNGTGSTYGSAMVSGGTALTPADSNIDSNWTLPDNNLSSGDSNDYPRMACNTTYGAFYNYPATSAGSITGTVASVDAEYDICPKGWRLPTVTEETGILSYSSTFNPVYGGYYQGGGIINTNRGYWWSSNVASNSNPYVLRWMSSALTAGTEGGTKYLGMYIRCVSAVNTK